MPPGSLFYSGSYENVVPTIFIFRQPCSYNSRSIRDLKNVSLLG
ncbi:hypothetical protein HNQ38_001056 [Desulfovibrio intestinalis]|uniref:Uncharacterized protein n=1 Tax=Desulfovibrio intestinalis TaxID=58621 RepID=A0A7W8C218_9BACT|nr:hypothetical protein [Desulfovibrio intestinalis]